MGNCKVRAVIKNEPQTESASFSAPRHGIDTSLSFIRYLPSKYAKDYLRYTNHLGYLRNPITHDLLIVL